MRLRPAGLKYITYTVFCGAIQISQDSNINALQDLAMMRTIQVLIPILENEKKRSSYDPIPVISVTWSQFVSKVIFINLFI